MRTLPDVETLRGRMQLVAMETGVETVDDGAVELVLMALEVSWRGLAVVKMSCKASSIVVV